MSLKPTGAWLRATRDVFPFGFPPPERRPTDPDQVERTPDEEIDLLVADPVVRWRAEQLAKMGFTPHQSRALALNRRVDLHFVRTRLIEKGCDPLLAFDIAN